MAMDSVAGEAGAVLVGALDGSAITKVEETFFRRAQFSGVTLFKRNIPDDLAETSALTQSIQNLNTSTDAPLLIAIDQEGGRVSRLRGHPFPDEGPAMELAGGKSDDEALQQIRSYGETIGESLLRLGINTNFAPVVDILTEPVNTAIGDRAFGTDVDPVCDRAGAFLGGMQAKGVLGCLKHFPGQGDAKVDTHEGTATVDLPAKMLNDRELVPFRALLNKTAMVMISHCVYPSLDSVEASRSPKIIGGLLRGEMGFRGAVVSDDMVMGAMPSDEKAWQEAIVESLMAGADLILVCQHLDKCRMAHDAIVRAAQKSKPVRMRLAEACEYVMGVRKQLSPATMIN